MPGREPGWNAVGVAFGDGAGAGAGALPPGMGAGKLILSSSFKVMAWIDGVLHEQ